MAAPLVSICIPAYKAERFIQEALESVRTQTYSNWEIIVTEDGKTDRTAELVQAFAATVTQPVRLNAHEKNRGLPATRNTGIAAAQGEWIAFLDSDDIWEPSHLADLVATATATPHCTIAYAGCTIFDDVTRATIETRAPAPEHLQTFPVSLYLGQFIIQPSAALVLRSAFAQYGPVSTEYPICNDFELWLRVASRGGIFAYTGKITCLYRKHGEAMSLKSAALIEETAQLCARHHDWTAIPAGTRRQRPADLFGYAARILQRENPAKARQLFARSLSFSAWQPSIWVLWTLTTCRSLFKKTPA